MNHSWIIEKIDIKEKYSPWIIIQIKELLDSKSFNNEEIIIIPEDFLQTIYRVPSTTKRKFKRLSINTRRLEVFMSMALWIINDIWSKFFQEHLWIEFEKPELVLFDWNISINWEIFSWDVAFDNIYNRVLVNTSLILTLIDENVIKSDIWFTLLLAHEIWHSIQKQLWLSSFQTPEESEHHADFIAGYTLHEIENIWLLDEKDLEEAYFSFWRFWDICDISRVMEQLETWKKWKNIWWDRKTRKSNLSKWYSASIWDVLNSFTPQIRRLIDKFREEIEMIQTI